MELFQLFQVPSVQGPRLTSIEEAGEDNGPVYLDLRGQSDVVLVQDTCSQAAEGLAGLAYRGVDLFV